MILNLLSQKKTIMNEKLRELRGIQHKKHRLMEKRCSRLIVIRKSTTEIYLFNVFPNSLFPLSNCLKATLFEQTE